MNPQEKSIIKQCIDEVLYYNEKEISYYKSKIELFAGSSQDDLMEYHRRLEDEEEIRTKVLMMKHSANPKLYIDSLNSFLGTQYTNLLDLFEHFININYHNYGLNYDPVEAKRDLVIDVVRAKQFRDQPINSGVIAYPMRRNPRYLILGILQIKYNWLDSRLGGELNGTYFQELFRQIGCKDVTDSIHITFDKNLTAEEVREVFKKFSKKPELRHVESCIVYLFGHGGINKRGHEVIYAKDYINEKKTPNCAIEINEIIDYFSVENCPSLAQKPKIFFNDACRVAGEQKYRHESSFELLKRNTTQLIVRGETVYNYSDILVINATHNHCFSHDTDRGSLFGIVFCEIAMKRAWNTPLTDLVRMTQQRISEEFYVRYHDKFKSNQVPELVSINCYKNIYFNPGLFE